MVRGEDVFRARGCPTCHRPDTAARGPILSGLFGRTVELASGETVVADVVFIRVLILRPRAKLVAGPEPLMPAYEGQLSEEELFALVGHVRSLGPPAAAGGRVQ
jgi:cytochrome c oxidase subunit 2